MRVCCAFCFSKCEPCKMQSEGKCNGMKTPSIYSLNKWLRPFIFSRFFFIGFIFFYYLRPFLLFATLFAVFSVSDVFHFMKNNVFLMFLVFLVFVFVLVVKRAHKKGKRFTIGSSSLCHTWSELVYEGGLLANLGLRV